MCAPSCATHTPFGILLYVAARVTNPQEGQAMAINKGHEIAVEYPQRCDFCDDPATHDGKTRMGPWAWMCDAHFTTHGPGQTGLGIGQRIVKVHNDG